MKAKEVIQDHIREHKKADVAVIAITDNGHWWHVHLDEEIPTKGERIAILLSEE